MGVSHPVLFGGLPTWNWDAPRLRLWYPYLRLGTLSYWKGHGTSGRIMWWDTTWKEHGTSGSIMVWRWGTPQVWTDKKNENITLPILRMRALISLTILNAASKILCDIIPDGTTKMLRFGYLRLRLTATRMSRQTTNEDRVEFLSFLAREPPASCLLQSTVTWGIQFDNDIYTHSISIFYIPRNWRCLRLLTTV